MNHADILKDDPKSKKPAKVNRFTDGGFEIYSFKDLNDSDAGFTQEELLASLDEACKKPKAV